MKRFLFLFFASLFALTTWAYNFSDESTGTTFYCNIVDDGAKTAEIAPDNFQYAATQSYCIDELVVPETLGGYTVIGIGADAFDYCTFKAVSLPSTLQYIKDSGFWCCTNMTEIDIPEGVTVIESNAFYQCTALKSVNIPSTVTTIGSYGFYYCTALSSITCLAVNPPSCAGAFDGVTTSNVNLYVPSESVSLYEEHTVWGGFNVQAIGDGGTSDGGDHEGDYLTPEIMGFDMTDSGRQDITYSDAPSGTEYYAHAYVRLSDVDYPGDFNFSGSSHGTYIKNTTSVGYLRKLTVVADEDYTGSYTVTIRASHEAYSGSSFTSYGDEIGTISLNGGGTLELTGDYEYFVVAGDILSLSPAKAIELVWEAEGGGDTGGSDAPYTVEPDEDVVQQSLSYVKFIAKGAICYSEEIEASEVKVYKDEVEVASGASVQDDYTSGTWDDAVNIYFDTTLVEEGEYKVVVPAGFMNLGSWTVYNDKITLNYTVDGSLDTGGTGSGDHEGDYLTPETIGLDLSSTSQQTVTYTGPSGTVYEVSARYSDSYEGDINFFATGYLKNTSSVGNLSKVIFEADEATTSSNIFYVRASNEPWDGSNFTSYGDEVGQVAVNEGGTIEPSSDYAYFACYGGASLTNYRFKSIEVVWDAEGGGNSGSGLPDGYTVDPVEGEVPSLSVISLDTEGGLGESQYFYDETKKAEFKVVNDETGETVATLKEWEIMLDETTWHAWAEIRLSNEVSEAGSYTVTIPEGVFLDATDYNYDANPAFTLHYTVIGGSDTGGVTHHENDYLTPEIMGFDLASSSKQTIESFIGPSGTDYGAYCYVGVLNEGTGIDYTGDFNISGAGDYIRNNESVGYLRQLIIEPDENYTSDYVLPVRVAHEPYTGSSYSAFSEYGELVAEIVVKEGGSVELSDDYEYFAVGTANNWSEAKRFKSIELVWEVEGAAVPQVTFDPESGSSHSELSEFTVICEEGLGFNEKNAISITRDGEELDIYVNAWEITDGIKTTMDFSTDEWGDYPTSLTEAGTYVITIPAGFFILGNDKVESKKLSVTYIIEGSEVVEPTGSYSYVVDPEEGQVESLSYIELTSDDENVDGFLGNYEYALYTQEALVYSMYERGDPITTATLASGGELDDYDSSIIITLKDEITDPGSYRVVIPEGSFYWIVNDEPILNDEIDLSYYIEAPQGEYTYDPEDGSKLSSLLTFTVYNSEGIVPSYNYEGEITVEDESGAVVAYDIDCEPNYPDSWDEPTPSCTITLSAEIVEPGTYTITIPEGYFIVGSYDADSKELVISYIIEEGSDSGSDVPEGYIIDPEDGSTLESLYTINIAYDGGDVTVDSSLRKNDAVKASLKVVDDESGETVATLDSYEMVKDGNGYQTYDLTFTSEITSSGSYTVTIPAGVFYDPNYVACAEFHLHYTIEVNPGTGTGINGFSINSENVEGIYSTSGQKLNKTQKGVNIIRFSDGTVKKLYVK